VPACIQWEQTLADPETGEPMQRSSVLTARIDGHIVHWDRVWHTRGDPITKQQHDYIVALRKWQKRYAPKEWIDPYKPLDLVSLPPIPPPPPPETSDE
jgi:hypothetical protein